MFRALALALRSNEDLGLKKTALEALYSGQFTLSAQLIKPDYLIKPPISPLTQNHSFYQKKLPLYSFSMIIWLYHSLNGILTKYCSRTRKLRWNTLVCQSQATLKLIDLAYHSHYRLPSTE